MRSSHSESKAGGFLRLCLVLDLGPPECSRSKYSGTRNTCPSSKGGHSVGSLNYCGFRSEESVVSTSVWGILLSLHSGLCTLVM